MMTYWKTLRLKPRTLSVLCRPGVGHLLGGGPRALRDRMILQLLQDPNWGPSSPAVLVDAAGRGTDILLGGSPKGLALSVLEYAFLPPLTGGAAL